jgi:hypothetical protein
MKSSLGCRLLLACFVHISGQRPSGLTYLAALISRIEPFAACLAAVDPGEAMPFSGPQPPIPVAKPEPRVPKPESRNLGSFGRRNGFVCCQEWVRFQNEPKRDSVFSITWWLRFCIFEVPMRFAPWRLCVRTHRRDAEGAKTREIGEGHHGPPAAVRKGAPLPCAAT